MPTKIDLVTFSRRSFLKGAAAAGLMPALPAVAAAAAPPDPLRDGSVLDRLVPLIDPVIHLRNANTGEETELRFFEDGAYLEGPVKKLNWMFRDWRQEAAPQIDVRLFWALAAIRGGAMQEGHSGKIQLLSGYRTRATNDLLRRKGYKAADKSYHLKARASDLRLEGVPMEQLAEYAEWLEVGGVGRYKRSNFVHIDSGPIRGWRQ
ncbi:YcbK family protein [Palleronia sp.]|uniref:YcbK family protein n=1 Tax=Palleronia sp. TaxID=1940284 RepID=UPI0035C86067